MATAKKEEERATVVADLDFGKVRIHVEMDSMKLSDRMRMQKDLMGILGAELAATAAKKGIKL